VYQSKDSEPEGIHSHSSYVLDGVDTAARLIAGLKYHQISDNQIILGFFGPAIEADDSRDES
jgi:hypothetical protein